MAAVISTISHHFQSISCHTKRQRQAWRLIEAYFRLDGGVLDSLLSIGALSRGEAMEMASRPTPVLMAAIKVVEKYMILILCVYTCMCV